LKKLEKIIEFGKEFLKQVGKKRRLMRNTRPTVQNAHVVVLNMETQNVAVLKKQLQILQIPNLDLPIFPPPIGYSSVTLMLLENLRILMLSLNFMEF